ncbi:TlpA family protein disulfide reductase [Thalassotalea euphylliae]|uniref:TlpA family protein disulfide reductase n=2 Tax=Thalassotalea euphylliae TaxID=1655234 RepID=A0A3E0TWI2_9GAMM|nr:TlpA family protein disulfide reductase [Thalassotalea euphylliae]
MAVFPVQALERGDKVPEHIAEQMALDPNKITVVDFFASWCVSCRIELPEINELSQHLNDPQVAFVGVEVDEELVLAEQFLAQMQLKFPVVMDQNQQVISAFEPLGMPALYYVYNNQILGVRFGAIPDIGQVVINDLATLRGQ